VLANLIPMRFWDKFLVEGAIQAQAARALLALFFETPQVRLFFYWYLENHGLWPWSCNDGYAVRKIMKDRAGDAKDGFVVKHSAEIYQSMKNGKNGYWETIARS